MTDRAAPASPAAPTSPARPSPWHDATVISIRAETARAKTFRLRLGQPQPQLPGQHVVVRLTAPDGYRAQRSYSVASPPDDSGEIEITVERLENGEVSSFLHDVVEPGDQLEIRGPLGGWFVWDGRSPALLVGGGSGIVPLMAMLRLARRDGLNGALRVVVSVRSPADLFYADELPGPETTIVYSRVAPDGWTRPPGRLSSADLAPLLRPDAEVYVCGSASFADGASRLLVDGGVAANRIRVERFGPTG